MSRILTGLFLLHFLALHSSIAVMEIASWSIFLVALVAKLKSGRRPSFPLLWPMMGLLAAVVISVVANPALKDPVYQLGFMRWMVVFWGLSWGLEEMGDPKFTPRFYRLWLGVLGLIALYSLLQFFTGLNPIHPRKPLEPQGDFFRATGFFTMSLTFAYVVGQSFLALVPHASRISIAAKVSWALVVVVGMIPLVASGVRGAWVGALAAGFVYVIFRYRKWAPHFIGGAALVMAVGTLVSPKMQQLVHMKLDSGSHLRLLLWKSYWNMFLDHPFTGVGLLQGDKLLQEYYARFGVVQEFVSHAHNVWLQWLGGAGVFAFGFYTWIVVWFLRAAWRLRVVSPEWGWSLLLAQIYFHVGALTEANFFDGEVNHTLMLVWAMTYVMGKRSGQPVGVNR
ncbi:MAG: O-antigen ligase family protein [Bdellovibrionales bacterium]